MDVPFNRSAKIAIGVLSVPSAPCVLLAGLHVYNETWLQWSTRFGWVNMWMGTVHSPGIFLILLFIALLNVALLVVAGTWWFRNRKNHQFPHILFATWFIVLAASGASYLPSDKQYLAASVFIMGQRSWQ